MGAEDHKKESEGLRPRCAILTVSDSRDRREDISGGEIALQLRDRAEIICYSIVEDDKGQILEALRNFAEQDVEIVLITGGTGMGRRDVTVDAIGEIAQKELPGFGELFRYLSYETIGSSAMMSRAIAAIWDGKAVFCMPGSPEGVKLAMERLIVPELGHIARELRR
jgi:molybdenum cofactor biosynthesis protein B